MLGNIEGRRRRGRQMMRWLDGITDSVYILLLFTCSTEDEMVGQHHSLNGYVAVVQLLRQIQLFATPWTAACQASLSITKSQSLLKFMSIALVMSSSVIPFSSHLQSFPASGSFQTSQFLASGGQSIGVSASASVLPMNIQDLFSLGWTG